MYYGCFSRAAMCVRRCASLQLGLGTNREAVAKTTSHGVLTACRDDRAVVFADLEATQCEHERAAVNRWRAS